MPRSPKPYYSRGAWRSDFGGVKNRVLVSGPDNPDSKFQAEKELLRLREEARLLQQMPAAETPFAVVVERFLASYIRRPAYSDFRNELHWFMGMDMQSNPEVVPAKRAGNNKPAGGRFGLPCKNWPIRRITADVVEGYLRSRKAAGLSGYHAFVALRTLMNWAIKKKYVPKHDLNEVDQSLRRKGRQLYIPPDADVFRVLEGAKGKLKDILLIFMNTGVRPKQLITVTIDEFDRENRQWILWRHKVVHRTGKPKVVPLASDAALQVCVSHAQSRPSDQVLFLNSQDAPWTYNALRLRWYRLRNKLKLDPRFKLYCLRHWFITVALESGENDAFVGELAGQADLRSLEFYKKLRNGPLHRAASRVTAAIERAGIATPPAQPHP